MDKEKWVQFPPRAVTLNVDLQPKQEDFTEKSPSTSLGVQSQEETIKNDQLNNIKSKANENPSRFHIHYSLPVKEKPKLTTQVSFKGNQQTIVTTYGDGTTATEVNTAVGQQVQWLADKTTRITTYRFLDGRTHAEKEMIPAVRSKPTYKGDLQTILTTFGDGTVKTQQNKAFKQRSEWSDDKKIKITTFTFEDAAENVERQYLPPPLARPLIKETSRANKSFMAMAALKTRLCWLNQSTSHGPTIS